MVRHAIEVHLEGAQGIVLARGIGALLLRNESSRRVLAETFGIKVNGTIYVTIEALKEDLLENRSRRIGGDACKQRVQN